MRSTSVSYRPSQLLGTLDLMQRFLSTLFPSHEPRVYNGGGQTFGHGVPAVSVYEAVG